MTGIVMPARNRSAPWLGALSWRHGLNCLQPTYLLHFFSIALPPLPVIADLIRNPQRPNPAGLAGHIKVRLTLPRWIPRQARDDRHCDARAQQKRSMAGCFVMAPWPELLAANVLAALLLHCPPSPACHCGLDPQSTAPKPCWSGRPYQGPVNPATMDPGSSPGGQAL
jgi:hypothetical protein